MKSTKQLSSHFYKFHPLLALACLFAYVSNAAGQENGQLKIPQGHSFHGQVFNEGPRQKAYLMGGTGRVSFPVTTRSKKVQQFINQGVGQLHGFWCLEAERSFRQAAAQDPSCAMAYWGAALANLPQPWFAGNEKRARGFIAEAMKRRPDASRREAMYIDALQEYLREDKANVLTRIERYAKAMEEISLAFPNDIEAKAFVALQHFKMNELRGAQNPNAPLAGHLAADALLKQVFAVEPLHPAHHFRIHLWDYRRPQTALDSAAVCGPAAPKVAHMWHMPGHIYSRLHRYRDACWHQEASARVDHAQMMRDRLMPDEIHNFAHNNEWLVRNLINVGRVRDAIDLAKNMISLPRHPRYNTLDLLGSARFGRQHLFTALSKYELWDELIALSKTSVLAATDNAEAQVQRLRYLGEAYYRQGDAKAGKAQLEILQRKFDQLRLDQQQAMDEAGKKASADSDDQEAIDQARGKAGEKFTAAINRADTGLDILRGYQAIADDDLEEALLRLELGGVDRAYLARVHLLAGDKEEALETIRTHVEASPNEVQPLAQQVDLLWQCGRRDEAAGVFERLRQISGSIDMQSPVFTRLAPIAKEFQLLKDWRVADKPADDIGKRPDLDSLGPFRWSPGQADDWNLPDAAGKVHALRQYRGKPLVLIFYLGYQCLHCAEQLEAFAPSTDEFAQAGISLLAVSTDGRDGLKKSLENYSKGKFPFPLVADPDLKIFKAYRCHDDFENQPLHGTFVIDADGKVLWQDISYEPFMDQKFVLKETKRLLAQRELENKQRRPKKSAESARK